MSAALHLLPLFSLSCLMACQAASEKSEEKEAEGEFVQPGQDDPTARPWTRAGEWYPEDPDELDDTVYRLLDEAGGSPSRARATCPVGERPA